MHQQHDPVLGSIHVLLVENDPICIELFTSLFQAQPSEEFELITVHDLDEANIHFGQIDLILADPFLHDLAGLSALAKLYSEARNAPLLVIANSNDTTAAQDALLSFGQEYLVKEYLDGPTFFLAIRIALKHWRQNCGVNRQARPGNGSHPDEIVQNMNAARIACNSILKDVVGLHGI